MSLITNTILENFYSKNNFIVQQANANDTAELIKQIDGIIKSKLGITIPDSPDDADPTLQNIACRLYVWFAAGKEGVTKEAWDYQRRKTFYNSAIEDLAKIKSGEDKIYNSDGTEITIINQSSAMFESTKRITGIL